jgi:RNA polymerase sigma factor (sigma-70 family)
VDPTHSFEEAQLVEEARRGCRSARGRLLAMLKPYVSAVVAQQLRRAREHFDVRAAAADVLAELDRSGWSRFDPAQGTLTQFACVVARRRGMNVVRGEVTRRGLLEREPSLRSFAAEDELERLERRDAAAPAARVALAALTPDERLALVLRFAEEEDLAVIAAELGRGRNAVTQLLHRAKRKARGALARHAASEARALARAS